MAALKNWMKMAWETQPVLVVSVAIGCFGPAFALLNPGMWRRQAELDYWPDRYILPSTKIEKQPFWKMMRQEHLVRWPENSIPWPFRDWLEKRAEKRAARKSEE